MKTGPWWAHFHFSGGGVDEKPSAGFTKSPGAILDSRRLAPRIARGESQDETNHSRRLRRVGLRECTFLRAFLQNVTMLLSNSPTEKHLKIRLVD